MGKGSSVVMAGLEDLRKDAVSWIAGWVNPSTGQGDPERDRSRQVQWGGGTPLLWPTLTSLFTYNDLARAIVLALPEWGLRHGWDLTLRGESAIDALEVASDVESKMDELGAQRLELEAAAWGQLFGGGLLLIGAADGRSSHEPLDVDNLQRIEWLRVAPAHNAWVVGYVDSPGHPTHGQPELYDVRETLHAEAAGGTHRYHASRVIRYPGPLTTDHEKQQRGGWDQSLLDYVVSKLTMSDGFWDHTYGMMQDGSQGVWKIKGLFNAVMNGRRDQIEARFAIADRARSLFKSMLLDADKEDFTYVHRQFQGISDLLAQSAIRTAAAAQMPVTVLFGQSPAGLNATGESDIRLWYDRVESYQGQVLRPGTEKLVRLILLSNEGPTGGVEPKNWKTTYRSVRKATPMEDGELRARMAQVDAAYIASGVYTAEEAAVNRFTPQGFSMTTSIDIEKRRQAIEAGLPSSPNLTEVSDALDALRYGRLAGREGGAFAALADGVSRLQRRLSALEGRATATQPRHDGRDGVMVAVMIPPTLARSLALWGEGKDLHITLAYLGRRQSLGDEVVARARDAVREFASRRRPIRGQVGGDFGRFAASASSDEMDVLFAPVNVPGLAGLRAELVHALRMADVPVVQNHAFVPHITLSYLIPSEPTPTDGLAAHDLEVGEVSLVAAGRVETFQLEGDDDQ